MAGNEQPAYWASAISDVTGNDVYVRGYPLHDLIGRTSFATTAALIIRGRIPTPGEARMLDVILCSVLDYGLQKSGTVAARCIASVNPQMLPAMAAAVLAGGEHALSPEATGYFIQETYAAWQDSGRPMDVAAAELVADLRQRKHRVPGFGHPVFRGVDPRSERLKVVAKEQGIWGPRCDWYEQIHSVFKLAAGKPDIVINDVGMIAAILAQMGYSPPEMAGIAMLSTMPGIIAHVSEEMGSGVRGRIIPDSIASYSRDRRDLAADLADAGWTIQSTLAGE